MTGIAIRDTQFASWFDPDAWMETMEGPKWDAILREEDAHVKKEIEKSEIQKRIGMYQVLYRSVKEKQLQLPFKCDTIDVVWINEFFKTWKQKADEKEHVARDVLSKNGIIWSIEDIGDGADLFELQKWTVDSKTPIWKKSPVGPSIGLIDNKLYYLGVKNKAIYHELWCCDADTGKNERRIYKENNPEVCLLLERHGDGRLKLIRDNSQDIEVFEIFPSGSLQYRKEKYPIPSSWILPLIKNYGIEFAWQSQGLIIFKYFGKWALWKCAPHRPPKKLIEIMAGQILVDPYAVWSGTVPCLISVSQPHTGRVYYTYNGSSIQIAQSVLPTGLHSKRYKGMSKDGTDVYGVVTYTYTSSQKPKKLLMIGYGAYGLPSNVQSVFERWGPLLYCGWAVGYTFLRGGGDHTEAWAKAGRLGGRKRTIQDFIALVKGAQALLKIDPEHTVIYGRSAGGLLVGDTLAKYPDGSLMKAVYTEVPYVDVLRTSSNPGLPLTMIEANEFGNPTMRLEDFIQVGLLSPADSAVTIKTENVSVLARTAEKDSMVYAYEPIKWIRRLRQGSGKDGAPKLCIVEKKQGHFTPLDRSNQQHALDCAILDSWIQ